MKRKAIAVILAAGLLLGGVLIPVAFSQTEPTVTSDKLDYSPGDTVTLTGTDWQGDDEVRIIVNDDLGSSWQRDVLVPVADDGTIVDMFNLPTWFVAEYYVRATGLQTGRVAEATFTDAPLPSSVQLYNWKTTGGGGAGWITGTLNQANSDYKEGETVPFRIDLGNLGNPPTSGDHWYAPVCRDYANSPTGPYGYTTLQPFDTDRAATPGGTISDSLGAFDGVGIDILQVYDPQASSGTLEGNTFDCGSTQRLVIVKFDVTGTGTKYLLWGGRLSAPGDTSPNVEYGNSSGWYPGGSLQMRLASPDKTGGINPGAIIQLAKLTVTKVVDSGSATPDQWCFTVTGPNSYSSTQCVPSGQSSVDFIGLDTGSYTATESDVTGYSFSGDGPNTNCIFSYSTATATVAAAAGEATNASCTFHNARQLGTLKLVKTVTKNDGGDAVPNDWTLSATAAAPNDDRNFSNAGGSGVFQTVYANVGYALAESSVRGYTPGSWSCDGGTLSGSTITLDADENVTCTINNDDIPPTLKLVKTLTKDDGGNDQPADWTLTATALAPNDGRNYSHPGDYGSFQTVYANVDYTLGESGPSGYTPGTWSCDKGVTVTAGKITLGEGVTGVTCTINNDDIPPTLKLVKAVYNGANPGGTLGPNDWALWAIRSSGEGDATRDLYNLGGSGAFETVFANAVYNLSESTEQGYQVKTDWSCDGGTQVDSTITLDLDEDVTCTIENEALGQVDLTKLTQGQLYPHDDWGNMTWDFTLTGNGVNETDSAPPSDVDFGGAYLIPGVEYTLCETGIPAGWTLEWMGDGGDGGAPDTIIPIATDVNYDPVDETTGYSRVYDPNYVPSPGVYSNDTRCVNFVVETGQTKEFSIDNQYPGGEPRTIGFWKNWSKCSGGNQWMTAAANGGPDAGWYILDDLLKNPGYTIGSLELGGEDCTIAVQVLDKSDVETGQQMSKDAAYNMAAQLLGAQLNLSAGAETCQEIVDAVNDGQNLLAGIGFDGTGGPYLRPNGKDKDLYYYALDLALILDTYNNGNLCGEEPPPPPPGDGFLHVSALTGESASGNRGRWVATVTVEAQDQDGNLMEGAIVSGVWSDGANGAGTCTTEIDGVCTIEKGNLKSNVPSVTFTVTGISLEGYVYDPEGVFGGAANFASDVVIDQPQP